jgi:hypothetical protein
MHIALPNDPAHTTEARVKYRGAVHGRRGKALRWLLGIAALGILLWVARRVAVPASPETDAGASAAAADTAKGDATAAGAATAPTAKTPDGHPTPGTPVGHP